MTSVVLDTNVVVSAHLNEQGMEALVFLLAISGKLRLYVSEPILAEYEEVLERKKFAFKPDLIATALHMIRTKGHMVKPAKLLSICPDADDNRFLECAETAGAEFLITGNKRHFPKSWGKTTVLNAREFLEYVVPFLKG